MRRALFRWAKALVLTGTLACMNAFGADVPRDVSPNPTNTSRLPRYADERSIFLLPQVKPVAASPFEEIFWDRTDQNFRSLIDSPYLRFFSSGDAFGDDSYGVRYNAYARNAAENILKQTAREYIFDSPVIYNLRYNYEWLDFLTDAFSGKPERGTLTSPTLARTGNDVLLRDTDFPKQGLRLSSGYRISDRSFGFVRATYGTFSVQGRVLARFDRLFGDEENIVGTDFILQKSLFYEGRTPRAAITLSAAMNGYKFGDGNDRLGAAFQYRVAGKPHTWDNARYKQLLFNIGASSRLDSRFGRELFGNSIGYATLSLSY